MEEKWISTEPQIWKPEAEGDTLQGTLIQKREKGGRYEKESFIVETEDVSYVVFGTTVLEDRMQSVEIGDLVKIIYKGTEKNKRNEDTKIFEVFKKKVPVVEAVESGG